MPENTGENHMTVVYSYTRFSHRRQEGGDSLRRQLAMGKAWLSRYPEHTLDTSLRLSDLAVSAFHGLNLDAERGDLGRFIALAKAGQIARGSILLLERLDRFSRQAVGKAYRAFYDLVEAGVVVQTLDPEMTIDSGNINDMEVVLPVIIYLQLAYEQSREKAKRIGAAWQAKRDDARNGKPISKVCPSWLKWKAGQFLVKPDGRKALLYIFKATADGLGEKQVAYELTRRFKPFGRAKGWNKSFVGWVLKNRQVLGEFQPMTHNAKGERVADGSPIPNYFPRVIADDLFYRANAARAARRQARGPSSQFVNLFSGLVYGADGYHCQVVSGRVKRKHTGVYVQRRLTSAGRLAGEADGCPLSVNYWQVEGAVLAALTEIKAETLATRPAASGKILRKVSELNGVEARLSELTEALTSSRRPVQALTKAIADMEARRDNLRVAINTLKQEEATADSKPWQETKGLLELLTAKAGKPRTPATLETEGAYRFVSGTGGS